MEDDLRRLVHDLKGYHSIICCAIDLLEGKPTELEQEQFQHMPACNLARTQSLITDLAVYTWTEKAFDSSADLMNELSSLGGYLQAKRLTIIPTQIQEHMDSLIYTLRSVGSPGKFIGQ